MSFRAAILMGASLLVGTAHADEADLQKQLLDAIRSRDVAAVRAALQAGADPGKPGEFGRTPLHLAVAESSEATELLLERGANPDAVDGDGRVPLHLAHARTAALLLKFKANLLVLDRQGNTALHTAAEADAWMCKLLIEAGLPVDARNNSGLTPLHFAALEGNRNTAEYLLGKGADINAKTLSAYSYKWTYIAWDVQGMEQQVAAGSTPVSIARDGHRRSKWVTGRYKDLAEYLVSRGAVESRMPAILRWLGVASPVAFVAFFWVIFHVDARLRGWDDLANRYPARDVPVAVKTSQDGFIGRVGMIQTRRMLRAAVTPSGLYLAMPGWVMAAHPPLMIPWSALRVESCRSGPTGERWLDLRTGAPESGRIQLKGGVASHVLDRIPADRRAACG